MTKRMWILAAVFALAMAAAAATPGSAQGGYIGGVYSWTNLNVSGGTGTNPTGAGYKLFIGHEFYRFLGVEAGYTDFGQFKKTLEGSGTPTTVTVDGKGWDVAATFRIPIVNFLGIYGKIGYLFWTSDLSEAIGSLTSGSASGNDVFYAAGLRFNLSAKIALLAEWEQDRLGSDFKVDMVNAGLRLTL